MLSTGSQCAMPTAGTEFHTYAVEWTSTQMRFYYDGQLCFTHTWLSLWGLLAPQPFDHPFYAVLTQLWGSTWNAVNADTPMSATLEVDSVRVWK
jgi:beta-glucanase (GH16 family)